MDNPAPKARWEELYSAAIKDLDSGLDSLSRAVKTLSLMQKEAFTFFAEKIEAHEKQETQLKVWVNLRAACDYKGVNYNSLSSGHYAWRRPNGGVPDKIINGRIYWKRETVEAWAKLGDIELQKRRKLK